MSRTLRRLAPLIGLVVSTSVSANIGIPMLAVAWPAYWIALFPVIFLEGYLGEWITKIPRNQAMKVAAYGNLLSTFVGIPVVWGILVAVEFAVGPSLSHVDPKFEWVVFPLLAAWIGPTRNLWIVYTAFVVLAVPFCIASIWIETRVALRMCPAYSPDLIRRWIRHANVASYALLCVVAAAYPVIGK